MSQENPAPYPLADHESLSLVSPSLETAQISPEIDVPRLFRDLAMANEDVRRLEALHIPPEIRVPSTSAIKIDTVIDVLRIVQPGREFNVVGVKVPSGVDEQPLGQTTIDGALNRLHNGQAAREKINPGEAQRVAWFSVENGLFRKGAEAGQADLEAVFDPDADYEDRAVAAICLPGRAVVVEISPASEAVTFPRGSLHAAAEAEGGLQENTAGAKLAEMGLASDKQNPHKELTAARPGGPLPRQDQMARVLIRGLLNIAAA